MKKRFWIAFVLTAAAGTALHFAYPLWPSPLVGLFAPVNESVWEHLKLLFWPFLAASFALSRQAKEPTAAWSGFLAAQLGMPLFLSGGYYLLRAGFALESPALDIGLYLLTLGLGFALARRVWRGGRGAYFAGVLVIAAGIYGAALILFTLAPPELPIFLAP